MSGETHRDVELAGALAAVRTRLAHAAEAAGRPVRDIELLPVTKFFPASDVVILHRLGCSEFGESREQEAAKKVEDSTDETLTYMGFPHEHWLKIRSNNAIERLNREIRRRTRVVGAFPDARSALMLVCARLRYVESSQWGDKLYLNMKHLEAMDLEEEMTADLTAG